MPTLSFTINSQQDFDDLVDALSLPNGWTVDSGQTKAQFAKAVHIRKLKSITANWRRQVQVDAISVSEPTIT